MSIQNLLRIEWMKIKSYRTFWVLSILFIFSVIGINFIGFYINSQIIKENKMVETILGGPFAFPQIWNTVAWMSSWLLYFPGFILIFLITNEYSYKTHRQNIIDGLSRTEFVKVKIVMAFLIAAASTILMFLAAIIFGLLTKNSSFSFENIKYVGYFFITSCIYILFAMLLALLFRRAALAVGIYFIFVLIFDSAIAMYVNYLTDSKLGNYIMPVDVADKLLPFPFGKAQMNAFTTQPKEWLMLAICAAWLAFYCWYPIRKFKKEDL